MKVTGTGRHKKILRRCAMTLATVSILAAVPSTAMAANVRLFIDPGHGGKDPGAVAGNVREKDTNLKISKMVLKSAKRQGWQVKMSRYDDRFIPLSTRPKMAQKWKATDFVSIHSNSMGAKPRGNMTVYRSKSGKRLGTNIMREMGKLTPYGDIGNRRDTRGLAVLRGARMPATIVEVLSVSSPAERKALQDPKTQSAYAEAIVKGVARQHGVKYIPPVAPKAIPKVENKPEPKLEVDVIENVAKAKKPEAAFAKAANDKKAAKQAAVAEDKREAADNGAATTETAPAAASVPGPPSRQWLETLMAIFNG